MDHIEPHIPTNIMIKSAYSYYSKKQPHYITDIINELYNYIYVKTDSTYHNYLEVEAKLGRFNFIGEYVQFMEFIKEVFQIPNYDKRDKHTRYDFKSGLDEGQFYTIWYFVEKECQINNEIKKIEPINYKETFYNTGKRQSFAYLKGELIKEEVIRKEDKHHINIRDNGNDFRITASKEMNTEITNEDIAISNRNKFRVSYKFRYFRLDFTIVENNRDNKIETTYEIELEFEDIRYVIGQFKKYEDFSYIIIRFIENIFGIYNVSRVEYYLDKMTSSKNKISSPIFGDYLEKNSAIG